MRRSTASIPCLTCLLACFLPGSLPGFAMIGIVVAFIALAVASRGGFDANFNKLNHSFGGGTVAQVISGASAGNVGPNLGNVSATVPTLFSIQGFMMWNFWSVYMSGELKSASNRRRQLTVMNGALVFDVVLLIIGDR